MTTLSNLWPQLLGVAHTVGLIEIIDVAVVAFVLYQLLRLLRGTQGTQIVVGLIVLAVVGVVSTSLNLVLLSWLFPRAAFWVLDRDGIKGKWGETQLKPPADDDEDAEEDATPAPPKGIGAIDVPDRFIYCLAQDRQSFLECFLRNC